MPSASLPSYFDELTANARKELIDSSDSTKGYTKALAVPNLRWHRMGDFRDQVVSVEAAERTRRAVEDHLQDPGKPEAEVPVPFVFSVIVFITYEDFFAEPDAKWKGPSDVAKNLSDAKLTFTGKAPADPLLAKDFHTSCEKLKETFDLAKTSGAHMMQGVILPPPGNALRYTKLRFTHRLFEKVQEGDEDDDASFPDEFTIHHWPVQSEAAKEALAEMNSTHRVIHLPAYDAEGQIIAPSAYKAQLRGALAQVKFTLSHWDIRSKGNLPDRDVFAADVVHIRILNPPRNYPITPKKTRKFSAVDSESGDISPKKVRPGPSVW